jgi:hypothetical protein
MINLPEPILNETIGQYIGRLMAEKVITFSQIHLAISKFNTK